MRRFAAFLRRPIVWSALGLVLLLILLYFVCDLVGLDENRLVVVLVVGVPLGCLWTGYWLRRYRENRRLTQEMAAQAQKQAERAGPDSLRDFEALEQEFKQAFQQLNQACADRGQVGGAAALPWILIMGPPAVGKSTALDRSGLRFTSLGKRLQGIGGTRNCTWWLTNEAVFLDTAGRYSVQDDDVQEWRAFLHLLRRRRQQPIDAVVLQIGLDELIGLSAQEIESRAARMRERLDELLNILQVHFPVHLVFNKCDLADGFLEFFSDLDAEEKAEPWGFTLDIATTADKRLRERFHAGMDGLVAALSERLTSRLLQQKTHEAREAVLCFPAEVANLKEKLGLFADTMFESRGQGLRPRLVGVFFTSAEQTGTRLGGYRKRKADELHLSAPLQTHIDRQDGSTYFLRGFFRQVVLYAEQSARPTPTRLRIMRINQAFAVAATMLACGFGSYYLADRYRGDVAWMRQLVVAVKDMQKSPGITNRPTRVKEEVSSELRYQSAVLDLLRVYSGGAKSEPHRIASILLRNRAAQQWLRPAVPLMKHDLMRSADREQNAPGEEFDRGFRVLKAIYILRGQQCGSVAEEDAQRWIAEYFFGQMDRHLNKPYWLQPDEKDGGVYQASLHEQLHANLMFLFEPPLALFPGRTKELQFNGQECDRARNSLRSTDNPADVVFNLRASNAQLYSRVAQLKTRQLADSGIEQVFTAAGCNQFFGETESGKEWWQCVLNIEEPKTKFDLEDVYRERYVRAWDRWIQEIRLRSTEGQRSSADAADPLTAAVGGLNALVQEQRPELVKFLEVVGLGRREEQVSASEQQRRRKQRLFGCENRTFAKWENRTRQAVKEWGDRKECVAAQGQLDVFVQTLPPKDKPSEDEAEASGLRAPYAKYMETARKLRDQLKNNVGGGANNRRAAEALKLVLSTMNATGDLWQLDVARRTWMDALSSQLSSKSVNLHIMGSGLDKVLLDVERSVWQALLPLALDAVEDQWKTKVYAEWLRLQDNHRRNQLQDPERIKPILDFFKNQVGGFYAENLQHLYKKNCELAAMDEPFTQRVAINLRACESIQKAIDIAATTNAEKAQGAGGSATSRKPIRADVAPPANDRACAEFRADEVELDTGTEVYKCPQHLATCSKQEGARPTEVRLSVKWKSPNIAASVIKSDNFDTWWRTHLHGANQVRFEIPPDRSPSKCKGFAITFDLGAGPGGGGPKNADDRWKNATLPARLR
ncbi:type VI secretion protein IcmF/TssM N-terminal domain-containing protein [Haliangium sp. UPWRP_2]|uniref:type VI secretion protein IcmF/TssM N-terminal domain-containing protein n=1 Tax=Haliangium sp. UPWRP_2 TaxID=1931276 RepID=UPI000D0E1BBF|nr:type VI secretion protein IcmF/TssM N-terminal domain-containing protein [Haliangium sp. UPWRP_2]PSM31801.1 hypothetical protein BVG81_003500 [Haliangium sp. UPWRP_2]